MAVDWSICGDDEPEGTLFWWLERMVDVGRFTDREIDRLIARIEEVERWLGAPARPEHVRHVGMEQMLGPEMEELLAEAQLEVDGEAICSLEGERSLTANESSDGGVVDACFSGDIYHGLS